MSAFQWDKSFLTGLDQVDEQHHALVDLINRFSGLLEAGDISDPRALGRVCEELTQYARYHFTEEQMFMDELGVDPRHVAHHVREHADFFLDLARMRTEVSAGAPRRPGTSWSSWSTGWRRTSWAPTRPWPARSPP
ncbi:MAG: hemerythrin domain-containing protein [Holophagaceae bacterium]|nr:hemerythrin domain-containing protein [Holophagaceae bacterium]